MSEVFRPQAVLNDRYKVIRKIGGGGMADVYLCEDLKLGRQVAIKVLLSRLLEDPTFVERFRREAKAAAGLNNPNTVAVYDWGEVDGSYFIVMEYVEGETLKELIRRKGRLGGNEAIRIGLQLLAALDFAHRRDIVHRDIKPQNIMIASDGTVKVMDFGIAHAGDSGMTEAGAVLGTARYLAPEQAKGQVVDRRSDLYSTGIVFYEMLTGTVPFKGDTAVTVALKHVNEMPTAPADVVPGMPASLNQIVLKAIAKDTRERYQTAAEFARDLRAALAGGRVVADDFDSDAERTRVLRAAAVVPVGATAADEASPPRKRRRWPLILALLILALAIAAAAYGLSGLLGGREIPNVVGQRGEDAAARLAQAGFKSNVAGEEYSDEYAAGLVIRQNPAAGAKLRRGNTVDLWVSRGSELVELPDFKGWSPAEVTKWLEENKLSGIQRTGRTAAVKKGMVYQQDPKPGEKVKVQSAVTYWVSSGLPQATVPDVTGLSQSAAAAKLKKANLKVGAVTTEISSTVPQGNVISQNPAAGKNVPRGSAVALLVSSGPPPPTPTPTPTPITTPTPSVSPSATPSPQANGADSRSSRASRRRSTDGS